MDIFNFIKDRVDFKEILNAYGVKFKEGDVYLKSECPLNDCASLSRTERIKSYIADLRGKGISDDQIEVMIEELEKKPDNKMLFTVSPRKNIFYCFGCHASGDVINLVERLTGKNQVEALRKIIHEYHDKDTKKHFIFPINLKEDLEKLFGKCCLYLYHFAE